MLKPIDSYTVTADLLLLYVDVNLSLSSTSLQETSDLRLYEFTAKQIRFVRIFAAIHKAARNFRFMTPKVTTKVNNSFYLSSLNLVLSLSVSVSFPLCFYVCPSLSVRLFVFSQESPGLKRVESTPTTKRVGKYRRRSKKKYDDISIT